MMKQYKSMPKQVIAKVISQKEVKRGCFRMKIESPIIARSASPGQFLHILCGDSGYPLLRRPISIHRIGKKDIEILYSVIGKGTKILSGKRSGDTLDIIGPLGNGFKVFKGSRSVKMLVAGGMGVAPLLGLADELSRGAKGKNKFIVVLGARTHNHILCEGDFKRLGGDVHIATEDGSKGRRGSATDLARDIVHSKKYKWRDVCIYTAGPINMVKALARLVEGCSIESQASLEERMACGLGACLGCAIETQSGYKRVCKDGPVFNFCEVVA
ncbi:MAG: dihydroorotate dehydrogenase electron transfer subunit [Candidatus Omnitrophica bacterium]|nr:dihydroorotate dehydrogenase electron transfer subunit [Candidatus Omnitrophota bacterium]